MHPSPIHSPGSERTGMSMVIKYGCPAYSLSYLVLQVAREESYIIQQGSCSLRVVGPGLSADSSSTSSVRTSLSLHIRLRRMLLPNTPCGPAKQWVRRKQIDIGGFHSTPSSSRTLSKSATAPAAVIRTPHGRQQGRVRSKPGCERYK